MPVLETLLIPALERSLTRLLELMFFPLVREYQTHKGFPTKPSLDVELK